MEKIETFIDEKVAKDLYRPLFKVGVFGIIFAVCFIVFYIVFSAITGGWLDVLNVIALAVSLILIMAAIYLFLKINQLVKQAKSFSRVAVYELLDEYISYEIFRDKEKIEEGKCYYKDLYGYKETKDTVFLAMNNNAYIAVKKVDGLVSFLESKGLAKTKIPK